MKHTQGEVCDFCNNKLEKADDKLKIFFEAIKKIYPDVHVSWTHRTKEQQEECLKKGTTHLNFPHSKHNALPSLAIDIFQINPFGAGVWDYKFCKDVNALQETLGFNLIWGGNFGSHNVDADHFEIKEEKV